MRIAIDAYHLTNARDYRQDGTARYGRCLIEAMVPLAPNDEFVILHRSEFEPPTEWRDRPNLRTVRAETRRGLTWFSLFSTFAAKREGADLLFNINTACPIWKRTRHAAMVHDLIPLLYPEWFESGAAQRLRFLIGHACKRADLLLANSEATAADVRRLYGREAVVTPLASWSEGHHVPRDEAAWTRVRGLGVTWPRYLFNLGGINPRKNVEGLIRAFALIAAKPEWDDVGLVVGGAKGWKDAPVFRAAEELGLTDRITFLGFVDDEDVPSLMACCEAFAYPSLYEGFGLPILEAMSLGAPVVTSNVSSLPEVGGDAAILCDPRSPEALASALEEALRLGARRDAVIASGLRRAAEFSWRATAEKTLAALRSLA